MDGKARLTTSEIINIDLTNGTTTTGGNITSDGGFPVTARGVCWSTSPDPTTADSKTIDGSGTGSFTSSLSGLAGAIYYVRAYATNNMGTKYGDPRTFTVTVIVELFNPATGRTWMDRNLGASREAISSTDPQAYGDTYQWGRGNDGHQLRTSGTTTTFSSSDSPGHGLFIVDTSPYGPFDWRRPQNDNLWQGVSGINNPCPGGYRLPSDAEWEAERKSWINNTATGAFASPLKLTMAGRRLTGTVSEAGSHGGYWSGVVDGIRVRVLRFDDSPYADISSENRVNGNSIRCIKSSNNGLSELHTASVVVNNTDSTATCGGYIISDGGYPVIARGICWSTSPDPTIDDNRTMEGSGTGPFTSILSGLTRIPTYYVRAYATNSVGTSYGEQRAFALFSMISPGTGRIWMDRRLDGNYQWGRGTDGHEKWMSETTTALSSSDDPGHGLFIIPPSGSNSYDWRIPQNDNLWQGVNGINNPCPTGYRLPTEAEWEAEHKSWPNDLYSDQNLKLGVNCARLLGGNPPYLCTNRGYFWSSTIDGTRARYFYVGHLDAGMSVSSRAVGRVVRCIKD